MVRMNYNPPGSASVTGNIHLPLDATQNLTATREQVNRILQLAAIVCPDEFHAYNRLLKPYWGLLRSWRRQGLLYDEEDYLISLAEQIRSYRRFYAEPWEDLWTRDPHDPYGENTNDLMMMERTGRTKQD
ncbi:hypothetical protein FRC06_011489 [Ceratobasidium sp. 370]|nr:hypothetical protein FRC06_011489 [Ceratobasidium sp. 370]